MKLGEYRDTLALMPKAYPVKFENGDKVGPLVSWRGVYADPSIDTWSGVDAWPVRELLKDVQEVLDGRPLHGWKGGEFIMNEESRLWADPEGEALHNIPAGITVVGNTVLIARIQINEYVW